MGAAERDVGHYLQLPPCGSKASKVGGWLTPNPAKGFVEVTAGAACGRQPKAGELYWCLLELSSFHDHEKKTPGEREEILGEKK